MNKALRVIVGTLLTGAVGSLLLVPSVDLSSAQPELQAITTSVQPNTLLVSCPGAFMELGGEAGTELGQLERIGQSSVSAIAPDEASTSPLISEFLTLSADGLEQSTALLSAVQAQYIERQRAQGLAATFCEQPTTAGWFVSGQSSVGAETLLLMSNPSLVDTQVLLTFHLPGGVVEERVALAAGTEITLGLASIVGPQPSYAIEFSSLGAPVAAALQHRFSRGLTPLGVSLSMSSRSPALDQWITPLEVFAEGYQAPLLRLFAPEARSEVIITAFSQGDPELFRQVVPAGAFLELPLELPNGRYALKIESDNPILAGVLNPSLEPLDHVWISPAETFSSLSLPIPNYRTQLSLTNPNAVPILVRVDVENSGRNSIQSVQLEPLSITAVEVAGDAVVLQSANQFLAALQLNDPLGYALINPSENQNLGSELSILVR